MKRKQVQAQHEEEYQGALVKLDKAVYDTEGPGMKEEMMDQLRDWCVHSTHFLVDSLLRLAPLTPPPTPPLPPPTPPPPPPPPAPPPAAPDRFLHA